MSRTQFVEYGDSDFGHTLDTRGASEVEVQVLPECLHDYSILIIRA